MSRHQRIESPRLAFGLAVGLFMLFGSATSLRSVQDVEDLKNGIVKIRAEENGKGRVGTGFIVRIQDSTIYIVTAAHVVEGDAHPDVAFFPRANEYYQSDILGIEGGDPRGVAALMVKNARLPDGLRAFAVSSNVNVRGGESIRIIGFPGEFGTPWLVAEGTIGGRRGSDISFSAVIGEGSSGGPLLLNSSVIGIISQTGSKLGYAVPISSARFALEGWGIEFTEGDDGLLPKEVVDKFGVTELLVPRGEFPMGGQHQRVNLDAFYINKTPATRARTWNDAANSCAAQGKRLPTEAEWEKAMRGNLILPIGGQWEWVADWYQTDYPRMRPDRNPAGPSVGESNEVELAQWDNQARSDADRWAEFVCSVPDICKNLKSGQGCWKGNSCTTLSCCSESERRRTFEGQLQSRMSIRPRMDMKKVVRLNADSRGGRFSRSNEFGYRCVRELAR